MTLIDRSVAVITGAGSGIGRALAVRLAKEGIAGVAISDVDLPGLEETRDLIGDSISKISIHKIDVSKLDEVKRLADEAIADHGRVTHLINNAGVGVMGNFEHLSIEDFEWLMSINFWGVIYGCKVFLPILKEQDASHIINISSVFGLIAPPEQSAYTASKFAVRGFTESLRHELSGTTVAVSCVHPGGVKTNIARSARLGEETPREWKEQGAKFFDKVAQTSPEKAAQTIIKGIRERNPRILIGSDAKTINLVSRLFPRGYLRILEKLNGHKLSLRRK